MQSITMDQSLLYSVGVIRPWRGHRADSEICHGWAWRLRLATMQAASANFVGIVYAKLLLLLLALPSIKELFVE